MSAKQETAVPKQVIHLDMKAADIIKKFRDKAMNGDVRSAEWLIKHGLLKLPQVEQKGQLELNGLDPGKEPTHEETTA